jgi:TolB-like protein
MRLFEELKRRNVFKVATAYVVSAWLLIQVADVILENLGAPVWVMQTLLGLLAAGFPIAVILAWLFELTYGGMKREHDVEPGESITDVTGRKLNFAIIGLLAVATIYFIWESRFQSNRVQSVAETTIASGQASASAISDVASLAVLPFVNLSSDPEQEYFSDGISEELLNVLAQYPSLRLVARTSSFQFKGDNLDIREIAELLQVNHILEGSVRKSGNKVRITAQLIEAGSGYHLWSQTYDRELDDIFAIQDDISASIGRALENELGLNTTPLVELPRVYQASSTSAYNAFLEARTLFNLRGIDNLSKAVSLLEQSILLDPGYAPAHAQLAISFLTIKFYLTPFNAPALPTSEELTDSARLHIERAEQIDPNLAELWAAKGLLASDAGKYEQALDFTAQALALNPAYIDALNWQRLAARRAGQLQFEKRIEQRMYKLDPYSVISRLVLSYGLTLSDPVKAHAIADGIVKQNPEVGYELKAQMSYWTENWSDYLKWRLLAYQANPNDSGPASRLAMALSTIGELEEALAVSGNVKIWALWSASRYREAAGEIEKQLSLAPNNLALTVSAGDAHYMAGDFTTALEYYDKAATELEGTLLVNTEGDNRMPNIFHVSVLREAGRNDEAAAILEKVTTLQMEIEVRMSEHPEYVRYANAQASLHILAGNTNAALDVLESNRLDFVHDFALVAMRYSFRLDSPLYRVLHNNERFESLRLREEETLQAQRAEWLELICTDNPIPETWQPLESTCEGSDKLTQDHGLAQHTLGSNDQKHVTKPHF